jgi:hypothetical protein
MKSINNKLEIKITISAFALLGIIFALYATVWAYALELAIESRGN